MSFRWVSLCSMLWHQQKQLPWRKIADYPTASFFPPSESFQSLLVEKHFPDRHFSQHRRVLSHGRQSFDRLIACFIQWLIQMFVMYPVLCVDQMSFGKMVFDLKTWLKLEKSWKLFFFGPNFIFDILFGIDYTSF